MSSTASARSAHAFAGSSCGGFAVSPRLNVDFVDARRATTYPVRIWTDGDMLQMAGRGLLRQVPMAQIDWRQAGQRRTAQLPDGGALRAGNPQDWDAWCELVLSATPIAMSRTHRPRLWATVAIGLALAMLLVWVMP